MKQCLQCIVIFVKIYFKDAKEKEKRKDWLCINLKIKGENFPKVN